MLSAPSRSPSPAPAKGGGGGGGGGVGVGVGGVGLDVCVQYKGMQEVVVVRGVAPTGAALKGGVST